MKINLFLLQVTNTSRCSVVAVSSLAESLVKSQPEENNSENKLKEVVSDTFDHASELDRALQRLVDDLELAVMGLSMKRRS